MECIAVPIVPSSLPTPHGPKRASIPSLLVAFTLSLALIATMASPVGAKPKSKDDAVTASGSTSTTTDGSLDTLAEQIGASELWAKGLTGEGVHVAVIDTGVAPVPALIGDDKVVALVDISFESSDPELAFIDNYGHGTHMAGIIAGNDPATGFRGIAPGAGIVAVKVGDSNGVVDVSQVIAAIDWVVEHRGTDGLNIRVLNLSYGTDGVQDYEIDPLAAAVERAWDAGIVVVVAAGNDGRSGWGLANPAQDPFVIAVGAAEIKGKNAKAAKFSTSAEDDRLLDLIAPGVSIESLRAPGSTIDVAHPSARVGDDLFKGSGSSQSAAAVSGAIALMLEARPELTPDQVKYLLKATAADVRGQAWFVGAGLIDIAAAVAAPTPGVEAAQNWPRSSGDGSLEAARGSIHIELDGVVLEGEVTVTGATWTGATWRGATWTGATWS